MFNFSLIYPACLQVEKSPIINTWYIILKKPQLAENYKRRKTFYEYIF